MNQLIRRVDLVYRVVTGATVADWLGHWKLPPQTLVLQTVDQARFHDLYLQYIADYATVSFDKIA